MEMTLSTSFAAGATRAKPARTARRGSVLILVVALLVLMALLGTAYISTTRVDRASSAQHTTNVQIDLLVEGVVNQVAAKIRGDIYDAGGTYRPADTYVSHSGYEHYDSYTFTTPYDIRTPGRIAGQEPTVAEDSFLAQRFPWVLNPNVVSQPAWRAVSYPVQTVSPTVLDPGRTWQFDTPETPASTPAPSFNLRMPFMPVYNAPALTQFTAKPWMVPSFKEFPAGSGKYHPALQAYYADVAGTNLNPTLYPLGPFGTDPFIAADADGDGIADGGLTKLPVGVIDGVTYYAAIRIIDNNSAINLNTAWSNIEFTGNATLQATTSVAPAYPGRYYTPGSIELAEMLRTATLGATTASGQGPEMNALRAARFNGIDAPGVYGSGAGSQPFNDANTPAQIALYKQQSQQDALYQLLGVRVSNPGNVSAALQAQAFTITDSMSLAFHFGLLNPEASASEFESRIYNLVNAGDSFYRGAKNYGKQWSSYTNQATGVNTWYGQNFDFVSETTTPSAFKPRRSMVVAGNPVSWQAPIHGTEVVPGSLRVDNYALNAGMPDYVPLGSPNALAPSPNKTSINQAPIPDLWRAFWNVMTETVTLSGLAFRGSPFDKRIYYTATGPGSVLYVRQGVAANIDPPTYNDPYLGATFNQYDEITTPLNSYLPTNNNSYDPTIDITTTPPALPTDYHPARMFRSPIRAVPDSNAVGGSTPGFNPATPRLNAHQTMLLRSAIAAVNAQDLRDADDDVTAYRVRLDPTNGAAGATGAAVPAEAVVYGTERQPYITEVYVDTDTEYRGTVTAPLTPNHYGYVAIELYNPYDQDILLKNWKLVAIDRRSEKASSSTVNPPYSNNALSRTGALAPATFYNLVLDSSTLIAEFDPAYDQDAVGDVFVPASTGGGGSAVTSASPLVVPARGYLLLENYYDSTYVAAVAPLHAAGHRPAGIGLPVTGPIPSANSGIDRSTGPSAVANARAGMPRLNVACVPGLSGMDDINWGGTPTPNEWGVPIRSVINRELVLLRPRRADGKYSHGVYPQIDRPLGNMPARPFDERPNHPTISPPGLGANEVAYSHLRDLIPVDSFDFTGLQLPQPASSTSGTPAPPEPLGRASTGSLVNTAAAWHYSRQNVDVVNGLPNWKFVYPGRYWAQLPTSGSALIVSGPLAGDPMPRQQGTQYTGWTVGSGNAQWANVSLAPVPVLAGVHWFSLGVDPISTAVASNENLRSSFPTSFRIPLAYNNSMAETVNVGTPIDFVHNCVGENPMSINAARNNVYPFGGFARDGDMLATPFIGAYVIRYLHSPEVATQYGSTFTVAEMNAVTMDAAFAEDADIHDDPDPADEATYAGAIEREQVGRFCPVRVLSTSTLASNLNVSDYSPYPTPTFSANYANPSIAVNDFGYDPSYQPASAGAARGCNWEPWWRYHWANDLFDYLSVRSPSDDYLPNYPMQRQWRGFDNTVSGSTPQEQYYVGDLVSYYNAQNAGGREPGHELYVCTADVVAAAADPYGHAGFAPFSSAKPVKNTSDASAAFRGGTYDQEHAEDNVPVEGLININTADWKVLSALPLVVNPATGLPDDTVSPSGGLTYRQLNQEMAKAIQYYRDIDGNEDSSVIQPHGPFRSIFELNRVVDLRSGIPAIAGGYPAGTLPGFQNGYGTARIPNTGAESNDSLGDLSPVDISGVINADGVRGDYEERFLQLTRISNMITTRSDSFTCYILVQGWRDAETTNAKLVVQRRVGYIMDRSRITKGTPDRLTKQAFVNN